MSIILILYVLFPIPKSLSIKIIYTSSTGSANFSSHRVDSLFKTSSLFL